MRFLRTTPGLSYQVIGDLVGEHSERCCQLLTLFTDSFDFSGELACMPCSCAPMACNHCGHCLQLTGHLHTQLLVRVTLASA